MSHFTLKMGLMLLIKKPRTAKVAGTGIRITAWFAQRHPHPMLLNWDWRGAQTEHWAKWWRLQSLRPIASNAEVKGANDSDAKLT